MAGGRPTKYDKKYNAIALNYLKTGRSITQLASKIGVNSDTIYKWGRKYPEFSAALAMAKEWSAAFWESELVDMRAPGVKSALEPLYFANRFRWHDNINSERPGQEGKQRKI